LDINIWQPVAGLALFLLAMRLIEEAIRLLAGVHFKTYLANHTNTPIEGILSGTAATAILQSSSFVSLLMLAFVGARLLPLQNALAVVLGANMGTTATGWIVATLGFKLDLANLALPLIGIGGPIYVVAGKRRIARVGQLILALGLLLLGLDYMKTAIGDASSSFDLATLQNLNAFEYLALGVVFSAIVQSSSATMLVALSALDAGIISLPAAAAVAIGADLGTTSTVLFGAIGGSANSKRLAMGHFFFNVVTNIVAFVLRMPILYFLSWIADPALTLVAFHSAFNLLGIIMFYPMLGRFTKFLLARLADDDKYTTKYIDPSVAALPETAALAVELEVGRLLHQIIDQNSSLFVLDDASISDESFLFSESSGDRFSKLYRRSKQLEGEILSYGIAMERADLTGQDVTKLDSAIESARAGVLSSKACQDLIADLDELRDYAPLLHRQLCRWQFDLYQELDRLLDCKLTPLEGEIRPLSEILIVQHQEMHRTIVAALRADSLSERVISSALNLNRLVLQSNQAIYAGVSGICNSEADSPLVGD
jgi:phosphate:Na+ symporter